MDMSTPLGFANSLYHCCNLREGSGAMMAPVCGSFVFMYLSAYLYVNNSDGFDVSDLFINIMGNKKHDWFLRSRGSTGRSKVHPMGSSKSASAKMGNLLCARTLILLLVCAAQGVMFVLEQPATSLMEFHDLFQRFIKLVPTHKLLIQMCDYGSPTKKPTLLYSRPLT